MTIDLVETETDRRYVLFFKLLKYQFISYEYGHLKCIYTIRRGQILVAKWVKQLKVFQNLTFWNIQIKLPTFHLL